MKSASVVFFFYLKVKYETKKLQEWDKLCLVNVTQMLVILIHLLKIIILKFLFKATLRIFGSGVQCKGFEHLLSYLL